MIIDLHVWWLDAYLSVTCYGLPQVLRLSHVTERYSQTEFGCNFLEVAVCTAVNIVY